MKTPEETAQWVIDNRYANNEKEKISDLEMYHFILDSFSQTKEQDKIILDLLNWAKSELSQEVNPKLSKTSTPYRREKIKFLTKAIDRLDKI